MAIVRFNTLSICDRPTGKEIAVAEVCGINGLIKGMVSQLTPNHPLLQNGFVYSCAFKMLKKIDYLGNIFEVTKSFGIMKLFECITYGPVFVKDVFDQRRCYTASHIKGLHSSANDLACILSWQILCSRMVGVFFPPLLFGSR